MIISDVMLSYPYIQHRVEVSHFTARKSTAIEWLILESINKCETLKQYTDIGIGAFFEQIFAISDVDRLIRPCLISLQDMGAISLGGISDETELQNIPMSSLKLTKTGRDMQMQGLLPGMTSEDTFIIYYDLCSGVLRSDANIYTEKSTGIEVVDIQEAEDVEFPSSDIREWLLSLQGEKRKKGMSWLTPTTTIFDIRSLETNLLWKNVSRKIELREGLEWKIVGEDDQSINEITLEETEFAYLDGFEELPKLSIKNPDTEIKKIVPIEEVGALIKEAVLQDNLFCVDERYYYEKENKKLKPNSKLSIGLVYGAEEFEIKSDKKQIIIKMQEKLSEENGFYMNSSESIQVGIINVFAGSVSKEMPIAYVSLDNKTDIKSELFRVVDDYYQKDYVVLFILLELGCKELFLEYVSNLVEIEETISKKAKLIEDLNAKSIIFYEHKSITAMEREKLLVNETYIKQQAQSTELALALLEEYSAINSIRMDEKIFQKILKLLLENMNSLDEIENIWKVWKTIKNIKGSYLNWINSTGMFSILYSKKSIVSLFERFFEENLFDVVEYTVVEQAVLNMRRINFKIQELLPELNMQSTASVEKYNELILTHRESLSDLYDCVRQWQEEENKLSNAVENYDEIVGKIRDFSNVVRNIKGISESLSKFFDDSFMKYKKVFIVDTCALMKEPALISWFDDSKSLLVIPTVVLEELDKKKNSPDDDEAYYAREAIRNINNYKSYAWLKIGEDSYPELLSKDLDKKLNDNKILSIAIKYSAKQPVLLTDDINFGNKANSQQVKNMSLDTYRALKEHERINTRSKKAKEKKKKRR